MVWKSVNSGLTLLPVCPWLLNFNQHLLPKILPKETSRKPFIQNPSSSHQAKHQKCNAFTEGDTTGADGHSGSPKSFYCMPPGVRDEDGITCNLCPKVSVEVASHPIKLIFLRLKNGRKGWIFLKPNTFFRQKRFWGKNKTWRITNPLGEELVFSSFTLGFGEFQWTSCSFIGICIRIISKSIKLAKKSYSPEN